MVRHTIGPLYYLYNKHHLCNSNWCHGKKYDEAFLGDPNNVPVEFVSEVTKKGYSRTTESDFELFDTMKEKFDKYMSPK